jgi:hypothetical protein
MKKLLIVSAFALAASAAFAQSTQTQTQSTTSAAVAGATNAGNSQTITVAPVTTNVASDLRDQGATAAATSAAAAERIAAINAAAALEIARINNDTGSRDLSADARAALDREAAIEIARLGQTVKNTPSIAQAALTSSNDTCMGSVSVGGSGPGFSIGVGTTYKDDNCVMLKNSRELWNMGMKAASLALMCTDKANREALEITGFVCPQTEKANREAAAAAKAAEAQKTAGYTGNDPVVQARLGLTK